MLDAKLAVHLSECITGHKCIVQRLVSSTRGCSESIEDTLH